MRGERVWQWAAAAGAEGGRVGTNRILWDGVTAFKATAAFGVYFVRVTSMINGKLETLTTTKIMVMKL